MITTVHGRILAVVPAEARFSNMSVNQRLRALTALGRLHILSCYPDSFPDDIKRAARIFKLPLTQSTRKGALRLALFGLEASIWSIAARLRGWRYSVVYCFQDISAAAGLFLKRADNGWVIDALDDPALELRNATQQGKRAKAHALTIRDRLFSWLVARADLVATIGSNISDPLPMLLNQEYGVDYAHIVPLMQALDLAAIGVPPTTRAETNSTVFYVGWVSELRGIHTLVEAATALRDRGVNLEVRLAGALKAADEAWLEGVGARYPGLIQYLGMLASEDTMKEIRAATVCVCPFPDRRELVPVQPIKVLEYLAAGKPVIASRLPGISAIVEDGVSGLLVVPGDAGQLADAIEKVLGDEALRESLGKAGRQRVRQFDVTAVNRTLQHALSPWL
jgi:glycosyltransferase involved in cell wall biosynthesis